MLIVSGRSASAASRWIHGLSPSRSNESDTAQRLPFGHLIVSAMGRPPMRGLYRLVRKVSSRGQVRAQVERIGARHALALELVTPLERSGGVDAEAAPVILVRIAIERRHRGQDHDVPVRARTGQ